MMKCSRLKSLVSTLVVSYCFKNALELGIPVGKFSSVSTNKYSSSFERVYEIQVYKLLSPQTSFTKCTLCLTSQGSC